MGHFTIGEAWSQALAFIRDNLQMMLMIVGGAVIVAGVLQFLAAGDPQVQQAQMAALQRAMATGDFRALAESGRTANASPLAAPLALLAAWIQSSGEFAALRLGLNRESDDTMSALTYGLVAALLFLLFVVALVFAAVFALLIPIVLVAVIAGSGGNSTAATAATVAAVAGLATLAFLVWISARLSVVQSAMAAARSSNPLYGFSQSWQLTRGQTLPIVGYLILLGLTVAVVALVVMSIFGIVSGIMGAVVTTVLSILLVSIPLQVLSVGIGAGIYRTLVPDLHSGAVFS